MSEAAKIRSQQFLKQVEDYQDSLLKSLAELYVAQTVNIRDDADREDFMNEDDLLDYCLDFGPNVERLKDLVEKIIDNPKHYIHPDKLK